MPAAASLPTFSAATVSLSTLRETLCYEKACILSGFTIGDHEQLKKSVQNWGVPILEPRNLRGGMIYEVCIDQHSDLPAYANTSYAFDFHTDCSEFSHPPDTVLLLCEQKAESGGESLLVDLDAVIPHLSFETLLQLQKPSFYFKPKLHPILSLNTQQEIVVRYQPAHFVLGEKLGLWHKTEAQRQALANLEAVIYQEAISFLLQPGDALLLNNQRCLHSRNAFKGQRLLKRVRFNLQA